MTDFVSHRFWSRVDASGDCWEWIAGRNSKGYGVTYVPGKASLAHRWAYEALVGPIPSGLQLDHLCRNKGCVNPDHLEVVTSRENTIRAVAFRKWTGAGNARKTHCPSGHPYDEVNTRIDRRRNGRKCRACDRLRYWRKVA